MPIRPENRGRYPVAWPAIRLRILARSGEVRDDSGAILQEARCEGCGVVNHAWIIRDGDHYEYTFPEEEGAVRIILTIAHLDHVPEHCEDANLRAWCQRCHNGYDAPSRAAGKRKRAEAGQGLLALEGTT